MIYLDHAATSTMSRQVVEAMWPYLTSDFGNPSSRHELGSRAAGALDDARARIASAINRAPDEIIFTSGGTESTNLAIKGIALAAPRARHIVTTTIEHESVIEPIHYLERFANFSVSTVETDASGRVDIDSLAKAITHDTTLCSVQYANSEVGTVQDIETIQALCKDKNVPLHIDAIQAAGILPVGTGDLISFSAHKFGGPKGVGALCKRNDLTLEPILHGGGQENGARSGTNNVAGAVGMAVALEAAQIQRDAFVSHATPLRDLLIELALKIPGFELTGDRHRRLPHHASFTTGVSGDVLVGELSLRDIYISSGSACAEGKDEPSPVLLAMDIDPDTALTAIRFTLGSETTEDDVETAARELASAVEILTA